MVERLQAIKLVQPGTCSIWPCHLAKVCLISLSNPYNPKHLDRFVTGKVGMLYLAKTLRQLYSAKEITSYLAIR